MDSHRKRVLEFWNERAQKGQNAGTNDFILKELEERTLIQNIPHGAHVLDVGCGNGSTLIRLAEEKGCSGIGIDYAEKMLEIANQATEQKQLSNKIKFSRGNLLELHGVLDKFDHIITQRSLINLETFDDQSESFRQIISLLNTGGQYYMIESFNDGNKALNVLREQWHLEPMTAPWHNLFFNLSDVINWQKSNPQVEIQLVSHFASSYYFLSRVVYAKLAYDRGENLRYDSDINLLSLDLPPLGEFGATKLIIWKKVR